MTLALMFSFSTSSYASCKDPEIIEGLKEYAYLLMSMQRERLHHLREVRDLLKEYGNRVLVSRYSNDVRNAERQLDESISMDNEVRGVKQLSVSVEKLMRN